MIDSVLDNQKVQKRCSLIFTMLFSLNAFSGGNHDHGKEKHTHEKKHVHENNGLKHSDGEHIGHEHSHKHAKTEALYGKDAESIAIPSISPSNNKETRKSSKENDVKSEQHSHSHQKGEDSHDH